MTNRRYALKALGIGLAGIGSPLPGSWLLRAQESDAFPNALKIPALLDGDYGAGVTTYPLRLQAGTTAFIAGIDTATWGINQSFLGPTLRLRNGDAVKMAVTNSLDEPTTIHWHGLHLPARCDGGLMQTIGAGANWEPDFTVKQKAGTFWYHSHMLEKSGPHVYQGLAGMIIIDDEETSALKLPSTYGVDDIPLIVQDRNFTEDGQFLYMHSYEELVTGIQGDTILVNGTLTPYFEPTTSRVRFRLLNAANARTFNFAFSDSRSFLQIASDGGLLEQPVAMNSLLLAPGERAELLVDFTDGRPVNLVSLGLTSNFQVYPGAMSEIMRTMNTQRFDILNIRPRDSLLASAPLPTLLTRLDRLDPARAVTTRRFRLNMGTGPRSGEDRGPGRGSRNGFGGGYGGGNFSINGRRMDPGFISERVPKDDIEIWEIYNSSIMTHPFHVHDIQFQILDRDGKPPAAHEAGRKDTVQVAALETVRLLLRFEDYADPDNAYMYHCHMLEHEDRGMMGMFAVID